MKKKIIVRGPALSRSGYGEQTRFALRALRTKEDEYDIYLINVGWGQTNSIHEDNEERRWIDMMILKTQKYMKVFEQQKRPPEFDMSLQITIPNEWEPMAPVNIGYTAGIESTKIAEAWIDKSNMMDKIIVVSKHAKFGFDKTIYGTVDPNTGGPGPSKRVTTPVDVVNYAVRNIEPKDLDLELDTDFNFLTVAQWGPRKNLKNTIKWFVEEFNDDNVGLVVKASLKSHNVIDRHYLQEKLENMLRKYPDRKCKVYLLHGDMSEEELFGLYTHPKIKAMVSLTHGEGYGLPLFEAAYNGLPVIAPDWGGQCDFLYGPGKNKKNKPLFVRVDYDVKHIQDSAVWDNVLIKDSMWCYPLESSSKSKMRKFYKSPGVYKKSAKVLKETVIEKFSEEKIYNDFVTALEPPAPAVENADSQGEYEEVYVV